MCSTKRVLPQPVGPLSSTGRRQAAAASKAFTSSPTGWSTGSWCRRQAARASAPVAQGADASAVARIARVGNALDRAFLGAHHGAREGLDRLLRALGVVHPAAVEVIGAGGHALVAVARVDGAGVATVQQLEQVVLRLAVLAEVADQTGRQGRVLHAVFLFAAFTQGAAVEADQRAVAEVAVNTVPARGIGHRHIGVVGKGHGLADQDLLLLGRVHVALATHDEFGPLHGAVAPDLGVVAVVADDQADLQALGAFAHIGAVAGVPALDRHPGHDLAVLLHDLALVVHEDQGVVGGLVGVLFMLLAGEREHAPDFGLAAGLGKDLGLGTGHGGRRVIHLLGVVHDAVGAVLGKDHQVHARQAGLHADQHVGDLACVVQHLGLGVQARHLVVDHRHTDGVFAAGYVAMNHGGCSLRAGWPFSD